MKKKIVFIACVVITALILQGCSAVADIQKKSEDVSNLGTEEPVITEVASCSP